MRVVYVLVSLLAASNVLAQFEGPGGGLPPGGISQNTFVTSVSVADLDLSVLSLGNNVYTVSGSADYVASCDALSNSPLNVVSRLEVAEVGSIFLDDVITADFDVAPNSQATWTLSNAAPGPAPDVFVPDEEVVFRAFANIIGLRDGDVISDWDVVLVDPSP